MSRPIHTPRLNANAIAGATCVLVMLYFGRDVLQPIALAVILSLVVAPLTRALGRVGVRGLSATLVTLLFAAVCVIGIIGVLASQLVNVSAELPKYRATIQQKVEQLRTIAERPFVHFNANWNAVVPMPARPAIGDAGRDTAVAPAPVIPPADATDVLNRLVELTWEPLAKSGLVMLLLLFILLEQESLQDRLIRLGRQTEISRTVKALGDAAGGVSRYFFTQFLVNTVFGIFIGFGLLTLGVPHALLWGTLAAVMRFIPYLGAIASGGVIACFAAAVDTGWDMALSAVILFGVLEITVSNLVEPKVYGHSTGLSPLAVVVSAVFWGTLWGPVGLLISTPLTVCLVVAGRHIESLESLSILLGQAPDVTAAQRFFQRSLSGEAAAILKDAQIYLRRASFARYCDQTLLPGLALAAGELRRGAIDKVQQERLRCTVVEVAEVLAPSGTATRRHRVSLLDANVGAHPRQLREARLGRWQGSLDVPLRSIVLCAGLESERDELIGELLARSLRESGVDARSVSLPLPYEQHDSGKASLVSTILVAYPLKETFETWRIAVAALRILLPQALVATVRLPRDEFSVPPAAMQTEVDMVLRSFEECLAFVSPDRDAA